MSSVTIGYNMLMENITQLLGLSDLLRSLCVSRFIHDNETAQNFGLFRLWLGQNVASYKVDRQRITETGRATANQAVYYDHSDDNDNKNCPELVVPPIFNSRKKFGLFS